MQCSVFFYAVELVLGSFTLSLQSTCQGEVLANILGT